MSIMSELHADLGDIHAILLGQRKVAQDRLSASSRVHCVDNLMSALRIDLIDDLLLEFEAAGVVWPDNIVELNAPCECGGDLHSEHGPWG